MTDSDELGRKAREVYEERWRRGDPWEFETSALDHASYARQIELISDRPIRRALEVGCGAGLFTSKLAQVADYVLALDVAPSAIERAQARNLGPSVEFRVANAIEYEAGAEEPFDLVVMSETIYSLGWLYPIFHIGYLVTQLFASTEPGGRLLMANTYGHERDWTMLPWLTNTYRDLARNVGYRVEHEEILRGVKDGVEYEVLITLFER